MVEVKLRKSDIKKINKKLTEGLQNYRKMMSYMAGDVPIQSLCLPKTIETILLNNGLLRVYDLFDRDLTEIKGLGTVRCRDLTSRLDQFLAMC
jgi:hypothetical protein